jgi:hypothetical protein
LKTSEPKPVQATRGARWLLSAAAVRERAEDMLELGLEGRLAPWRVDLDRMGAVADYVARITLDRYPALDIPFHARWRHFSVQDQDQWTPLIEAANLDRKARARTAFDLATISVLLDAGAGSEWRYTDAKTKAVLGGSEGLAIASLRLFARGTFSANLVTPLRVDASALEQMHYGELAEGLQDSALNVLPGAEDRAALLRRLGKQMSKRPDLFALEDLPRPGGLFDVICARAEGGKIPAAQILELLLEALGPIWAGRATLEGLPLGDCWTHSALNGPGAADRYVPLHKLSQWLAYSLVEPLETAGIQVVELDGLTGLAEYRNGGLFMDMGVLDLWEAAPEDAHQVDDPVVVGWRSMTVALLHRLAPMIRKELGVGPDRLPLARILQGGTWAAGRRVARRLRADGSPPIRVVSDGTVF